MPSYKSLAKSLAKFDDSNERNEIAAIEAEQQRDREAVERAEAVIAEARTELIKLRSGAENIDELVDNLRTGTTTPAQPESEIELERKIENYAESKNRLLDAIMHRKNEIEAVKSRLRTRLTELSGDVSSSLDAEVATKLKELSALYADAVALAGCLPSNSIHALRSKMSPSLVEISKHWRDFWGPEVSVDPELIAALEQASATLDLVNCKISRTVKLPHP